MNDPTETIRREQLAAINAQPGSRESLEAEHGQVWDTQELGRDFDVEGFLAPYVIARRKSDRQRGSLMFQNNPRFYFRFEPHHQPRKEITPMMSLEVIVAVNNEIAREAAREGFVPYVPFNLDEVDGCTPFTFPNIGYLKPRGWKKTAASWFVDKTGHGLDWEPALTWKQFRQRLTGYILRHPGHGFAVTEEGEFQVVVSAFKRVA